MSKKRNGPKPHEQEMNVEDERFSELMEPEKKAPVSMYGVPIPEIMENYQSSDDEVVEDPFEKYQISESEDDVYTKDSTSRLAIKNLDWKRISAIDVLAFVKYSAEKIASSIEKVTVYLSKFGEQFLAKNEINEEIISEALDVQSAAWRKQKKGEFKCYFAIVEFSDSNSANDAYSTLSQCEINDSGNFLDVSVVPNDIDFSEFKIRDSAKEIPENWDIPDLGIKSDSSTKHIDDWDKNDPHREALVDAAWEDTIDEDSAKLITSILLASDDEDSKLSKNSISEMLKAMHEEEEDGEVDEIPKDIEFSFVPKSAEKGSKKGQKTVTEKEIEEVVNEAKKIRQSKKGEKKEDNIRDEVIVDSILNDDRFTEELNKPGYGINATESGFKKDSAMDQLRREMAKKHQEKPRRTLE